MDSKEKKPLPEPRTYTVEQIAAILNIGRTTAYQLVKEEQFRIVRIGNAMTTKTVSCRGIPKTVSKRVENPLFLPL